MATFSSLLGPGKYSRMFHAICAINLGFAIVLSAPVFADTIVTGIVTDETTGAVVHGVSIVLSSGSDSVAQSVTGSDGKFLLQFDSGIARGIARYSIKAEHDEFDPGVTIVHVDSGRPDKPSYPLSLIPKGLGRCKQSVRGISVGHFEQDQFAEAITTTLNYTLIPRIQMVASLKTFDPDIATCHNAKPQSLKYYERYAQVLNADVLLGGQVELQAGPQHANVKLFVGDRYGLFKPPRPIENKNVNLRDAEASQLNPRTNGSILMAIAKGLGQDKKYQQCVDLLGVAERIDPTVAHEAKPIRAACEAGLPNRGLLRGETP